MWANSLLEVARIRGGMQRRMRCLYVELCCLIVSEFISSAPNLHPTGRIGLNGKVAVHVWLCVVTWFIQDRDVPSLTLAACTLLVHFGDPPQELQRAVARAYVGCPDGSRVFLGLSWASMPWGMLTMPWGIGVASTPHPWPVYGPWGGWPGAGSNPRRHVKVTWVLLLEPKSHSKG